MRCVAQIAAGNGQDATEDERFDVNVGLSHFSAYVFQMRRRGEMYGKLYDWLMARGGGRGQREGLTSEMHLFLTEVIFDLAVSSDNSTADAATVGTSVAAETRAEVTGQRPLNAEFFISRSGHLAGTQETILASVLDATHNLKWRNQPYLSVRMSESEVVDEIVAFEKLNDVASKKRRLELLDEQRWQAIKRSDLERGFQLILFFQRPLFPDEATRDDLLVLAMQSYALLCQERGIAKASNFDGPLVSENLNLQDTPMRSAIRFGIQESILKKYLMENFADESLLHLGVTQKSMRTFPEDMVAISFVPLLVKALLESMPEVIDIPTKSPDYVEVACELRYWQVGVS